MGHTISTYHDLQMKGIEYMRGIYSASALSIRPKTRVSKIDALKEIIRAWGLNPDGILTKDALTRPNATIISRDQLEERQLHQLSVALNKSYWKKSERNRMQQQNNKKYKSNARAWYLPGYIKPWSGLTFKPSGNHWKPAQAILGSNPSGPTMKTALPMCS